MDKRISTLVIMILGVFFAKISFEVSFASSNEVDTQRSHRVDKISSAEVPREIK